MITFLIMNDVLIDGFYKIKLHKDVNGKMGTYYYRILVGFTGVHSRDNYFCLMDTV
jgi:hypothetical protein